MTPTLLLILAGCAAMALLQAALGAFFPASHRPWWHALPRAARPLRPVESAASQLPTVPVDVEADVSAPSELIGQRHAPVLSVVETTDRRQHALPFVGRDRRLVGRQEVEVRTRRDGTVD
jgi:hypothetical protein